MPDNLFLNQNKTQEGDVGDGILNIFNRYNFTVKEDEPLEKEVAVDPEMLGKVFENLLEVRDRKSKGTYYTPREIVHYMCQESLIHYLSIELEREKVSKDDIECLIKVSDSFVEHDKIYRENKSQNKDRKAGRYNKSKLPDQILENASLIDQKLADVKICDPAVGSGAFPVGMMNEIIRVRNALTPHLKDKTKRTSYDFKRHAIEYCLYGVDIEPGAVEIARLRLWLSLVVDEEEREMLQALPNLDYKIVCGHSLLGMQKDDFNGTPNMFYLQDIKELHKKKNLYFNESNLLKKQRYKEDIDQFINKITEDRKVFDFEFYFSEVFIEKKGFDIIIANPPYIKEATNKSAFNGLQQSPYYQGKMDIWYFFACKGIDISKKESGIITLQNFTQKAKVSEYEREIDQIVYKLYDLTSEDMNLVEKGFSY